MRAGVILYGPPASGKDTVTRELERMDGRYQLFSRLKVGDGRTAGYRVVGTHDLDALRAAGDLVWENKRYGAVYAIDRAALVGQLATRLPVLHLGQPEAIPAVRAADSDAKWVVVYLWCARTVAHARIEARGTGDTAARLRAWDQTPDITADLRIDTGKVRPEEAARLIEDRVTRLCATAQP